MRVNNSCPQTWKVFGTGCNTAGLHFPDNVSAEPAHYFRVPPQGTPFHKISLAGLRDIQNWSKVIVDTDINELL